MYDGGGKGERGWRVAKRVDEILYQQHHLVEGGHTTPQQSCQRKRKKIEKHGQICPLLFPDFFAPAGGCGNLVGVAEGVRRTPGLVLDVYFWRTFNTRIRTQLQNTDKQRREGKNKR